MKELTEQDVMVAEEQASRAEQEVLEAIAESEADAAEVAYTVRALEVRLEDEARRGSDGIAEVLADLREATPPIVPIERHRARLLEARADAARARLWVVAAMRDDLKRFGYELGDLVKLADRAREALQRVTEEPRVSLTRRFERIRTVTADLLKKRAEDGPAPRRQLPRLRLDTRIDLHSDSNFFVGISANISDGGIFVVTEQVIPIGTEVDLAFTLADNIEIRGRGTVRWSRPAQPNSPAGLGVQFAHLSGAAHEAIQAFVSRRSPLVRAG